MVSDPGFLLVSPNTERLRAYIPTLSDRIRLVFDLFIEKTIFDLKKNWHTEGHTCL